MGGGITQIEAPEVPQAPTVKSSLEDFIQNLPALFASAQEFQPQFAELQQQINRQTAPLTEQLQETLAGQALEGIQADVPEFAREQFLDAKRAQLGQNVGSPIGADAISRGLRAQQFQFQKANQQLALSLAGRQQLIQPPSQEQLLGGFNTGQALGFNQGIFGTQANIFGSQANMFSQSQANATARRGQNIGLISDITGGVLGAAGSSI